MDIKSHYHYLPVSERNIESELYLTSVGTEDCAKNTPYPIKDHPSIYYYTWESGRILPDYAIIYTHSGQAEFESKSIKRTTINAGDIFLIIPGQWHRYRPVPGMEWHSSWICFNGAYPHHLKRKNIVPSETTILQNVELPDMEDIFLELLDLVKTDPLSNNQIHASYVLRILGIFIERLKGSHNNVISDTQYSTNDIVNRAIAFIWNNSHRPINAMVIAQALSITRRTLERNFASFHERTVSGEIRHSRVNRSKKMLKETSMPIKEIAYACGFGNSTNMIRVFEKIHKCTPSEYRMSQ